MKFCFLDKDNNLENRDNDLYLFLRKQKFIISQTIDDFEDIYLFLEDKNLFVCSRFSPKVLPIKVDFSNSNFRRRITTHSIQSELLNKCLGKKHKYESVLDATAGMGTDTMLLAALGLNVVACEKSALIYLLLQNGLLRAKNNAELKTVAENIHLVYANSLDYLSSSNKFDIIYLDFMFSSSDKKSKSKKNMEIFKKINLPNEKISEVERLDQYLGYPFKRLIYKKPLKSSILRKPQYSHSIKGKAIRFDIYVA